MIDGPHLCEIDQTGEAPRGLARSKEAHCKRSVARLLACPTPENKRAVIEAYDEWAVIAGAPTLQLTGWAISADDMKAAAQNTRLTR